MRVKSYKGKVYGAELTKAEEKAMNMEINRQIAARDEQYKADIDATVLYTLLAHYGWKKKKLKKFWDAFIAEHKALREFYQMDELESTEWLAHRKLKEIGVDINEWYQEVQSNNE